MDGGGCVRFTLELEVDREPIAGRLLGEAGVERRFQGVLDLLAVLNRVRAATPDGREVERDAPRRTNGKDLA